MSMPSYEIEFWNSGRLQEFWDMAAAMLKFAAPGVLIAVAIIGVGMLLTIVIAAFKKGADDDDRRRRDDDDDFDVKYY